MAIEAGGPKATDSTDPYRSFRFRLRWDGRYVAGVSRVSALTPAKPPIGRRAGGEPSMPRRMPGGSDHAAITLERGVTHDVAFAQWANGVREPRNATPAARDGGTGTGEAPRDDFRRDILLEVRNEAGQTVVSYLIHRCWPSEFVALPEPDGDGTAVSIESLKLENEGWERDPSIAEPGQTSVTLPSG